MLDVLVSFLEQHGFVRSSSPDEFYFEASHPVPLKVEAGVLHVAGDAAPVQVEVIGVDFSPSSGLSVSLETVDGDFFVLSVA